MASAADGSAENRGARERAHVRVSGRVQGVFFRDAARDEARRLNLAGWISNLPDGRVEAVFEGDPDAVGEILRWCERGPEQASVQDVEVSYEEPQGAPAEFEVR